MAIACRVKGSARNSSIRETSKQWSWEVASVLIYMVSDIWKELNRRIFQHVSVLPVRMLSIINEGIKLRQRAEREREGEISIVS
jgi:hypothetical protein